MSGEEVGGVGLKDILCTSFIRKINVDITDVDDLQRGLST